MHPTPRSAGGVLLVAGVLAAAASAPADGQSGSRLPVVRAGDPGEGAATRFPLLPGLRFPEPGARPGSRPGLPLDPDARGLARALPGEARKIRPRPLRPGFFPVALPLFGYGGAYAPGEGRPDGTGEAQREPGAARERAAPARQEPGPRAEPGEGEARPRTEVACFEVAVRLAGGGTHRIRVDGAPLGAGTPDELEAALRDRMASEGALALDGLDGVQLHLAAARVDGVRARRCPAVIGPGAVRR